MSVELNLVENEFKEIYQKHFDTIRTRVNHGRIKSTYHYLISGQYADFDIKATLQKICEEKRVGLKINIALGYILRNIRDDSLRFFHPSYNSKLFPLPVQVKTPDDAEKMAEELRNKDVYEHIVQSRPSTEWKIAKIVCIRFDVYNLSR